MKESELQQLRQSVAWYKQVVEMLAQHWEEKGFRTRLLAVEADAFQLLEEDRKGVVG